MTRAHHLLRYPVGYRDAPTVGLHEESWVTEEGVAVITEDGEQIIFDDFPEPPPDTTPNPFMIAPTTGAQTDTVYYSAPITVTGIDTPTLATVTDCEQSLNGGLYTASPVEVDEGDVIILRRTSSGSNDTTLTSTLDIGGVSSNWLLTTGPPTPDTTPDAFSITDEPDVDPNTLITSAAVTITGIDSPTPFTVTDLEYAPGPAFTAWTTAPTNVNNNFEFKVRRLSSPSYDTPVSGTVTCGGVSDTWTVTTATAPPPADITPDQPVFSSQTNATLSTDYESNIWTMTGFDSPTDIAVTNCLYSIDNGAYDNTPTTITVGQTLRLKVASSGSYSTPVVGTVEFDSGAVSATFTVTTTADPGTGATTALLSPSWLDDPEDYQGAKVGTAYYTADYRTVLDHSNALVVTSNAELYAAVATAKGDGTKKAIHLTPLAGGANYTWTSSLLNGLNRAADDPLTICTLPGSGSQAKVSYILEQGATLNGVAFVDLDLPNGLGFRGGYNHILIERCSIRGLDIQGIRGSTKIPGTTVDTPGTPINNVVVRLNWICDNWGLSFAHFQGLFAYNFTDMLVEGNIIDHNGWDPVQHNRSLAANAGGPDIFKHNVYTTRPGTGLVMRYNWISRAASHWGQCKGSGHVYRNMLVRNPLGQMGFGGDQFHLAYGIVTEDGEFRNNVLIDSDNITPSLARGIAVWVTDVSNLLVDGNVAIDNTTSSTNDAFVWVDQTYPVTMTYSNNKKHNWNQGVRLQPPVSYPANVTNGGGNIFSGTSISGPAQALANALKTDAAIDTLKAARKRLGIDIAQLKSDMATLIAGVT